MEIIMLKPLLYSSNLQCDFAKTQNTGITFKGTRITRKAEVEMKSSSTFHQSSIFFIHILQYNSVQKNKTIKLRYVKGTGCMKERRLSVAFLMQPQFHQKHKRKTGEPPVSLVFWRGP